MNYSTLNQHILITINNNYLAMVSTFNKTTLFLIKNRKINKNFRLQPPTSIWILIFTTWQRDITRNACWFLNVLCLWLFSRLRSRFFALLRNWEHKQFLFVIRFFGVPSIDCNSLFKYHQVLWYISPDIDETLVKRHRKRK